MKTKFIFIATFLILLLTFHQYTIAEDTVSSDIQAANTNFAITIFKNIAKNNETVAVAPYSISHHIAALYAGSDNETKRQIQNVFGFPEDSFSIGIEFKKIFTLLNAFFNNNTDDSFARSNIWVQDTNYILKEYYDYVSDNFLLSFDKSDFFNDPDGTKDRINTWIYSKSGEKLKDYFQKEIKATTRMAIVDLFNANLSLGNKFYRSTSNFNFADGSAGQIYYLSSIGDFPLYETSKFKAITIDIPDTDFFMTALLPTNDITISDFRAYLTADIFDDIYKNSNITKLFVKVPELSISSKIDLRQNLTSLGMGDIFTGRADFSKITGTTDLFLNPYIQEVSITTTGNNDMSISNTNETEFIIDKPFIFTIVQKQSNTIIVIGEVTK